MDRLMSKPYWEAKELVTEFSRRLTDIVTRLNLDETYTESMYDRDYQAIVKEFQSGKFLPYTYFGEQDNA